MNFFNKIFSVLQKIGQSLMIPVSVLPAAGLLVAIGRILKDNFEANSQIYNVGSVFFSGGISIFENLAVIFAMGVAVGFSQGAGVAALSAGVGYFTLSKVLSVISGFNPGTLAIDTGIFGGIAAGVVASSLYNKFHQTQLHPVLGFFSGKRLVPILTAASCIILGLVLGVVWPPIQLGINHFGQSVLSSEFGPALYAAGKRLLIPLGLHHVYYQPFLYEFGEFVSKTGEVFKGDSARYIGGDPTAGKFMASEFPIMLFGLPMAALAMTLRTPKNKRKAIAGVMMSAALTSIITGITEPIEFAFIFVAPILFVIHVLLAFLSGFLTNIFDIHLGYTFSASLIDFVVGFANQKNSWALFFVVGPLIAAIYFGIFYYLIGALNLKTPGREVENNDSLENETSEMSASNISISSERPRLILEGLGGKSNIEHLDACITRLRVTVKDPSKINKDLFKKLGAAGTLVAGNNCQVIFGVQSEKIKDEIRLLMNQSKSMSQETQANALNTNTSKKELSSTESSSTESFKAEASKVGVSSYNTFSDEDFLIPIEGDILKIEDTPDETFSQKMLGEGFLINPSNGIVLAPIDAEVMHLFPTNHAIALRGNDDLEVLIHIGIDTVKMNGEGFKAFVKIGDKVKKGDKLIEFDLNLIKSKAKSHLTPIIFTNPDKVIKISPRENYKYVTTNYSK